MDINLPKWLARLLFPKLAADLSRRAELTGTASRSFEIERGPFRLTGVAQVDERPKPEPDERPRPDRP